MMAGTFILAIDQGTTSSRALVVDGNGDVCGAGHEPFPQHFPAPGLVEHDPLDIWKSTEEAIATALAAAGVASRELAAIGITNQRETVLVWDRATGEPLAPAIVWQDRRTVDACEDLKAAGHEALIAQRTGLTLDPYFSATKLAWLLDSVPGLRDRAEHGEVAAGTVDSWLAWQITGGKRHVTDYTNASRTLLFNILRGRWDDDLCALFRVPRNVLPAVQPSCSRFGRASADVLGAEVPILAIAGDQQSALFGQGCLGPRMAKNTYGTGCFLLANAGAKAVTSRHRLLVSMGAGAGQEGPEYVVEGSVFVAGSLVQWLRDGLGIISSSGEIEALAESVPDGGGVTIVPAFTGLGAPYWDPNARGAILGLTRGATRAHIARAALEAIALSSTELVRAMDGDLPEPIAELRVDGGASRDNLLMQLQADYLGIPVVRPRNIETTAMGAAYLAGIGAGMWASAEETASLWEAERTFEPAIDADEREGKLGSWRAAVQRTLVADARE
ncbi:MAG: glycerol kinase GlpK [Chloroflexi bacterium]|nr:glycerol kinase GlpK [Chloroflexota bacterium]